MPVRHVILDRDGVLNREAADGGWIWRAADWQWEPGALIGLRLLHRAGIRISVATNQSGMGRGIFTMADADAVNARMLAEADAAGAPIDAVFVCPHAPEDGCGCRKPAAGLIVEAVAASGITAAETIAIGDAPRDLEAARGAGVAAVLVRTGKGRDTEASLDDGDVAVYDDLESAAHAIVCRGGRVASDGGGPVVSIREAFHEHADVMATAAVTLEGELARFAALATECLATGGKILACGNGGSAADAQHLTAELVCRFSRERRALPAIALGADAPSLTAIANDLGYERVFARQVEALGRPGDLLVAISTSGRSVNVIEAARLARTIGCTVVAMTGADGGPLAQLADLVIAAPSRVVARIQEVHSLCIHIVADAIEAANHEERQR